jgi:hypothetical protein
MSLPATERAWERALEVLSESSVRYKNEESIANFKNNRNKGILSHRQPKRLQNCSKKDHPEALQSQAASKIEVRRCRNDV